MYLRITFKKYIRKLASTSTLLIYNLKLDLFILIALVYSAELLTDIRYKL